MAIAHHPTANEEPPHRTAVGRVSMNNHVLATGKPACEWHSTGGRFQPVSYTKEGRWRLPQKQVGFESIF